MSANRAPISFTVIFLEEVIPITAEHGEYRSLMALLRNRFFPDGFGECGGMGRCATCLVEVESPKLQALNNAGNEPETLQKFGISKTNVRLSCQILIDENLDGAKIRIPD